MALPDPAAAHEVQLHAVHPDGPEPLAVPGGVNDVNEAFDAVSLGVYEGLRTFDHVRFLGLREHMDRAQRGMVRLGWDFELDRDSLGRALHEVVSAYPLPDARVRFDVLAAPAFELGTSSRTLIALSPFNPVSPEMIECGVAVQLIADLRRTRPLIKEAEFVIARRVYPVGAPDAYEPIMVDEEGRILEGTSSNFFAVKDGALHSAESGVLQGITHQFLVRLAHENGIRVVEEAVRASELGSLEEAFLASSIRSIVPIVRIDGVDIGSGRPGPITKGLLEAYMQLADREARPA
jgi:branched-chain amino acid aminotransferase